MATVRCDCLDPKDYPAGRALVLAHDEQEIERILVVRERASDRADRSGNREADLGPLHPAAIRRAKLWPDPGAGR